MYSIEELKLILELVGSEQISMLIKDNSKYRSGKYKLLEQIKVKTKNIIKEKK